MERYPSILVLGARGMVGHTVYNYLKQKFPYNIFGTIREDDTFFSLKASSVEKDLSTIFKEKEDIGYVINCIAILNTSRNTKTMEIVNTVFPQRLDALSHKYRYKVIHISSDAVFNALSGNVTESSIPFPEDTYGVTKLKGEPTSANSLSIRTSFLGFDPVKHQGLLEWALRTKQKYLLGYTNQLWAGCTALQFAMLCEKIFTKDAFTSLREKASLFHFAPIGSVSKYQLLKDFIDLLTLPKNLIASQGKETTRILATQFSKDLWYDEFVNNHIDALKELIKFERITI